MAKYPIRRGAAGLAAGLALYGAPVLAANQTPITLTGFNADVIAEAAPAAAYTSTEMDSGCCVLYSTSYRGLAAGGLLAGADRSYQLQPFSQANALILDTAGSATLTFASPTALGVVSVLATATNVPGGGGRLDVDVLFSDGAYQRFSQIAVPDWHSEAPGFVAGLDRITRGGGSMDHNSQSPTLFALDLPIDDANFLKPVIGLRLSNSGMGRIVAFAAAGQAPPEPVPTMGEWAMLTFVLLLAGGAVWRLRGWSVAAARRA